MNIRHCILLCALAPLGMQAQQPTRLLQQNVPNHRPRLDVPAIVASSDRMQFIVYRLGHTRDGRTIYKKFIVRNDRREDLLVAVQKLKEGQPVMPWFGDISLGDPLVEFYAGAKRVLRLDLHGDRIICSSKEGGIILLFGDAGVKELEKLLEGFIGPRPAI